MRYDELSCNNNNKLFNLFHVFVSKREREREGINSDNLIFCNVNIKNT